MAPRTIKEVNAPYIVDAEDKSIGRETIIIRHNGEPVAVILPYAAYTELIARQPGRPVETSSDESAFEREEETVLNLRGSVPVSAQQDFQAVREQVKAAVGQKAAEHDS